MNCKRLLALILTLATALSVIVIASVSVSAASVNTHDVLFDWEYYYAANPDVARAFGRNPSALRNHYNNYGKREGRAPSRLFDPKVYINLYPDLKAAFGSNYTAAYNHFVSNGIREGRQGSSQFSVSVYKSNYEDLRRAFGSDNLLYLKHYREYGLREGRNAITKLPTASTLNDVTRSFAGKTVTLKSVENGRFMAADGNVSNTPALCNRTSASTWETFTVTNITSDGWVGFKAYNGKYLSALNNNTNTPVKATASRLQSWECFRIYQKGSDYYIKAQVNGKYLCVRVDTYNAPVQAYASNPSTWERFAISIVETKTETSEGTGWQWPMNGYTVTQTFNRYSKTRNALSLRPWHCGIDMVSNDTVVRAAADGTVIYRGYTSGNGNHVIISHTVDGKTVKTLYSHLANFNGCPSVNQSVSKGTQIGVMGNTGNSTAAHLHFAVFTGGGTDPLGYTTYSGSSIKMTEGSVTFYNPEHVINTGKLS